MHREIIAGPSSVSGLVETVKIAETEEDRRSFKRFLWEDEWRRLIGLCNST